MNIGSFNVRGISSEIKKNNIIKDLIKYKLDVIAIQETKAISNDEFISGHRLITFDHENPQGGLGFVISRTLVSEINAYWRVNDRLAVLLINNSSNILKAGRPIIIINVHLPTTVTTKKNPGERNTIYNEIEKIIRKNDKSNVIIAGDFNSKIGTRIEGENCCGHFSKGIRNENGQKLIDFCSENELFITNSAFKHPSRHITTWEGAFRSQDNKLIKVFNQIDFIIFKQQHKKQLINSRTFSGTNINTDHRLLVTKIKTASNGTKKYKKYIPHQYKTKTDFSSLKEKHFKSIFEQHLDKKIRSEKLPCDTTPSMMHQHLISNIIKTREETLPTMERNKRRDYCPTLQKLSEQQKQIRMNIASSRTEEAERKWRRERNNIMHRIKAQSLKNYIKKLDNIATEIQQASDSTKMFKAVKHIKQTKREKIIISDSNGKVLCDDKEIVNNVKDFFQNKYKGEENILPFETISILDTPITGNEVGNAISQLNNNRASGLDTITPEELKCLNIDQQELIANMLNDMFTKKDHIDIGSGKLILLNKPNKKKGPIENLRPIVLLSTFRKVLSLITLHRIRPKVEEFLSSSQSGFRKDRSTSDIVWAHRWLKGRTEKYKEEFSILGIDMSSAFDTICRTKLLSVLDTFLEKDDIKLIRALLANTTLSYSSGNQTTVIETSLGTPQGDSLSPILFIIYLEAALRDLRTRLPTTNRATKELIYADDVDFIFDSPEEARTYIPIISNSLKNWNLKVNESKTEITTVKRHEEEWKSVRKLGSLINEKEDIKKRKVLAQNAFIQLKNIWKNKKIIHEQRRIQIYEALVTPILTYNSGTWGLTKSNLECLDSTHRRHLRIVIGVHWPEKISNQDLYDRCRVTPLSVRVKQQRWKLFGHILRRDESIPAQTAMKEYFKEGAKFVGRTPTSLPTTLNQDLKEYKKSIQKSLQTSSLPQDEIPAQLQTEQDLLKLKIAAQNRDIWKELIREIHRCDWEKDSENIGDDGLGQASS